METLLDGWEYHTVRHKRDRPFPLGPEGSHPRIVETEAMMHPKLNSLHDHRVERGCVSDPTPWRDSSARNSAKIESWDWVRTARSLEIEDDAERRRRHSHAEHGNE